MFSLCWSCKTVSQTNAVNWSIFIWKYTKTSIINVFQFCFGPRCVPLKTGSCFSRLLSSFHPPADFSFTLKLQFCTTSLWRPTLSQKVSILPQKFKCFQINKILQLTGGWEWRGRVTVTNRRKTFHTYGRLEQNVYVLIRWHRRKSFPVKCFGIIGVVTSLINGASFKVFALVITDCWVVRSYWCQHETLRPQLCKTWWE